MMGVSEILSALTAHSASLIIAGDRVRVLFPSGHQPPSDLIDAAKANRESLRALLLAKPRHRYTSSLSALQAEHPRFIDADRWRQAVEDGRRFLATWGEQAEALGWTSRELFGLHTPPEWPHPSYERLSRYGETGLVWLLQGRPVVALTAETAAIQTAGGRVLTYRKHNKPPFGPVGDSLDDFDGAV